MDKSFGCVQGNPVTAIMTVGSVQCSFYFKKIGYFVTFIVVVQYQNKLDAFWVKIDALLNSYKPKSPEYTAEVFKFALKIQ